jgi:alkanesulfonate monooxygenase SsuD/methylene tetrahydromethanopterin reductase-like flavin-dependent oxidoreductase (luciferase family)
MKLGFVIPSVGPAINSAAGLSAFCRALEDLGYDTLWVADRLLTPVDMQATYPGKEQPYPPQMTRNFDPALLWTDVFALFASLYQMLDFAGEVITRSSVPGNA